MILWIARRELLEHIRSARFLALSLLCVLLLPAATYVDASQVRARELFAQELETNRVLGTGRSRSAEDQGASRFGWRSGVVAPDPALRAIRHPAATELLARGIAGSMPAYWQFSTEGVAEGGPADTEERQSPVAEAVDVMTIVQTVLGLLAILIAFDSVSGELESGRMRTILAHPVSRVEVLAGKFLGALATLVAPLLAGLLAVYTVLWIRGLPVLEASFLVPLAGLGFAALLYLATLLALGITTSAVTRESRTSLVVLLVIWICATLAIPSGAALAAQAVSPVQPLELMRASLGANLRHLERERAQRLAGAWLAASGSRDVPRDGTISTDLRTRYAAARATVDLEMSVRKRALIENLEDARERQKERQASLEAAIGRLSPAVVFARACIALAGTGSSMRRRWRDEVRREQRALEAASFDRQFGVELFAADLDYLRIIYWPDASDPAERMPEYGALPVFSHRQPSMLEGVAEAAPDLCLLGLECIGLLAGAAVAYARLDV